MPEAYYVKVDFTVPDADSRRAEFGKDLQEFVRKYEDFLLGGTLEEMGETSLDWHPLADDAECAEFVEEVQKALSREEQDE
jgi:hypothetical protein